MRCRIGEMQARRDVRMEGCRKVECRKREVQERKDAGKEGCRKGGVQKRKDAGKDGCRKELHFVSSLFCTTVINSSLFLTVSKR